MQQLSFDVAHLRPCRNISVTVCKTQIEVGIPTSLENPMELQKRGSRQGFKMETSVTISCLDSIWVNLNTSLDFPAWILFGLIHTPAWILL